MTTPGIRLDLPTTYAPSSVESGLYRRWIEQGVFTPTGAPGRPPYCIVIPPPNVTGSLHMGHAFQHTLMDALTRRRRMQGYDVLWLPGTDHAGIATQNVVERALAREGRSRHDLGREAFVERVWAWKESYGGTIGEQMRRLGAGVDWTRERFTMDEGLCRAVRTMFARLYHDGLIYRAERIINWCPRCLTALSDIEVDAFEEEGELVSISYGPVTVATTRVETMLGDTAVAVHPGDERYAHLVGTEIELPLTGRRIPIIADEHVDPAFGTGAVKVTPAHDPNDFEIGRRHGLPSLTVMDERGIIIAHGPFQGLDRFEARSTITAALRAEGRIVAERRPYLHAVPHCDRCQTVVEPRLSLQWFVAVATLARAAGDMVRDGRTTISPPELAGRFFGWVDDMHDWCISRQLWWGHRIPVWYCSDGHVTVPPAGDEMLDPDRCGTCGATGIRQDVDVLDTWFSSGLWPFSTLGWPQDTADLRRFYPTAVLLTGYDIIFFWVARMMMLASYTMPDVPFRTVALTGLIRDVHGKKMSKSWGNAIDPLALIDSHGADALRFTLARGANPGADVPLSEEAVDASRNFVNKLWNATRFALMNGADPTADPFAGGPLSAADRWILSRLRAVVADVDTYYEQFEFARACETLFHFARDELFDWYLELAKIPLRAGGPAADPARAVLGRCFDVLLRLLHPVIPFVTEKLWTALTGGTTVVTAPWPVSIAGRADPAAEAEIDRLRRVVTGLRQFRANQRLRPGRRVAAVMVGPGGRVGPGDRVGPGGPAGAGGLAGWREEIGALCSLDLTVADRLPGDWPAVALESVSVALDLSGALDTAAERARLSKLLAEAGREKEQVAAKLANPNFTGRAPVAVVEKTRQRLLDAETSIARLAEQLAAL
ncbi:valine--tRNA ligase [Frankia sp. CcWB2]